MPFKFYCMDYCRTSGFRSSCGHSGLQSKAPFGSNVNQLSIFFAGLGNFCFRFFFLETASLSPCPWSFKSL